MAATVISVGIQKGGAGKSSLSGISAYLLSKKKRVLAVDFDSQGNLTQLLTQQDIYDFNGSTVLEAVKEQDPRPYIHSISDNLHILTAEDKLATFSRWLYTEYRGKEHAFLLKHTLDKVKDDYDYIWIDLPPALGDQTINGLIASDLAVVLMATEVFCYNAVERYIETILHAKKIPGVNLEFAGILATMIDPRTSLNRTVLENAKQKYEGLVFETVLRRNARVAEFPLLGISTQYKDQREALEPYLDFLKELLSDDEEILNMKVSD